MNPNPLDLDRTPAWHSSAASRPEAAPLVSGRDIGRYRLGRVLGEGNYGRVNLAQHEVLGRRVAIKLLHQRHGSSSQEIRAFLNEALVLAEVEHVGIVPIHDAGWTEDGLYYIVSRYVEGGDLGVILGRRRLTWRESAEIALAVAEAIHYAHAHGLVHRDIKPANILMDLIGRPLVADFGVALRDQDFGRGARLAGTPAYMSPEQARGEGHRVDGRSDVFSLGVVLYEMLTGRRPFRGETQHELAEQVIAVAPLPPRRIEASIPDALERICLKALEKRASDRYPTAEDMAKELKEYLQTATIAGIPPGSAPAEDVPPDTPILTSPFGIVLPSTMSSPGGAAVRNVTVRPRGLRPFESEDADYFLDLLPGPRDREGLPDCVGFWRPKIEGLEGHESFRVGLIFGPSGCGKTSMVRAGLLPRLPARIEVVSIDATADDTESLLLSRLQRRCPDLPHGFNLTASFIAARKGRVLPLGSRLLVVIDQFERWLRAERGRDEKGMVDALRQCDGEHIQALLVVRDDCWLGVSRLMREIGDRIIEGGNAWALDAWDPRHARGVLSALVRAHGALPEGVGADPERFLDAAISDLAARGPILPVQLVLLAEMIRRRSWRRESWRALGGAEDLDALVIGSIFDAGTAPVGRRIHRKAARSLLRAICPTLAGSPGLPRRSARELLDASGYSSRHHDFATLISILVDELGFLTADEEQFGDEPEEPAPDPWGRSYRLTHEYLERPLAHWLAREGRKSTRDRVDATPRRRGDPRPVRPIDINTATGDELTTLPGVGPAIARRIMEARPCRSSNDLLRVKGINHKKLDEIQPLIRLD